jgi:ABC-type antimicrobial peptide transport system permease subunit
MRLLAKYNLKSLLRRKAATASTALSFALAVAVFVVLMSLAKGVLDVHHRAGKERNIVVLQKGASDAHFSSLSSEDLHKIRYREFVARTAGGRESVSPELELVSWVTLPQAAAKHHTNVRGVTDSALDLHGIQLEEGKLFRGASEAILGESAAKRFGLWLGEKFTAEDQTYTVTGIFSCSGSVIESEVWCDLDGLMAVSGRMATTGKYSSMVIRVRDGYDPHRVCNDLSADKSVFVDAKLEKEYYRGMGNIFGQLEQLGLATSLIACIGAMFSGMNTMYNSVARRTHEIGVLRAIGFSSNVLLIMFIAESSALGLVGGAIGLVAGQGMVSVANQFGVCLLSVAFSLDLPSSVLVEGMLLSVLAGLLGGLLPARRAARLEIVKAVRYI